MSEGPIERPVLFAVLERIDHAASRSTASLINTLQAHRQDRGFDHLGLRNAVARYVEIKFLQEVGAVDSNHAGAFEQGRLAYEQVIRQQLTRQQASATQMDGFIDTLNEIVTNQGKEKHTAHAAGNGNGALRAV